MDCKVTAEPRFKVGDFVEANVGSWSGAIRAATCHAETW